MPKKPATPKPKSKPKAKKHHQPTATEQAALNEPAPSPVPPGAVQMPGNAKLVIQDITEGIGPSPQTVARLSVRTLTIIIAAAIAALLALAGIILPNLPASEIPPQNQTQ